MCTEYRRVDVIIPTYKPDERVVLLVKKLLKQSYPLREIHLIDTDTGIFPEELAQLSDNIKVTHIPKEKFDHGGTRHMGMLKSKAEIVVYMTQDALPANEYLIEEMVKPFAEKDIAVSYARQLPDQECKVIERYTRSFNYPKQSRVKSIEDLDTLGIKTYFCSQ